MCMPACLRLFATINFRDQIRSGHSCCFFCFIDYILVYYSCKYFSVVWWQCATTVTISCMHSSIHVMTNENKIIEVEDKQLTPFSRSLREPDTSSAAIILLYVCVWNERNTKLPHVRNEPRENLRTTQLLQGNSRPRVREKAVRFARGRILHQQWRDREYGSVSAVATHGRDREGEFSMHGTIYMEKKQLMDHTAHCQPIEILRSLPHLKILGEMPSPLRGKSGCAPFCGMRDMGHCYAHESSKGVIGYHIYLSRSIYY